MFDSLLIANRGEIACRVIRTARRMGVRTVAVYSDADAEAPHVEQADDAVRIGPAPAAASYLNQDALLAAVAESGAQAVHPGYGFLSENAGFAAAVENAGAVFVGPPASAIAAMGAKIEAKGLALAAGVAVVPGYAGAKQDAEALLGEAEGIGYPVLIKASLGGGGKGMRVVNRAEDLPSALAAAKREAQAAFGDDAVLLERYLASPKHIEVQVLADAAGNTLSLFERDCSVQRRHQKVIEEAPAPTVGPALRQAMGTAAVRVAEAVGYRGAGTVEFIAESPPGGGEPQAYYFMEMNTRLQVEHPVTEAILGLDLVEWQLRIAAGEALPFGQEDLAMRGHAVEARLYAENAKRGFLPSTGRLRRVSFPAGARADTGIRTGSEVTAHYDPMLAKVIAHASTRREAVAALRAALGRCEIAGVEHNVAWLRNALAHPEFAAGAYTTGFAEAQAAALKPADDGIATAAALVATVLGDGGGDPWQRRDGFQINLPAEQTIRARRGRKRMEARLVADGGATVVHGPDGEFRVVGARLGEDGMFRARVDGRPVGVRIVQDGDDIFAIRDGATERLTLIQADAGGFGQPAERGGRVAAPMPGRVVAVHAAVGDRVRVDQVLIVLEAMKMEHNIRAGANGTVTALNCAAGDSVAEGALLASVESAS